MNNSTTRFSNRADNYVKYRPSYPTEIFTWLTEAAGFTNSSIVADVGSGTGIFTQLLLENGNKVYAIEPNKEMREKAEASLHKNNLFNSISGTAEHTTLPSSSVDFIMAAQAFHWFNIASTKQEFLRIAKSNSYCVLIWNERQLANKFDEAYEQLLVDYSLDYREVNHKNIDEKKIAAFFAPNAFEMQSFYNEQVFNLDGLKGRLLSSSYTPGESHSSYKNMVEELEQLFEKYNLDGTVKFSYQTKVYVGKLK